MDDNQKITLETYEKNAHLYLTRTTSEVADELKEYFHSLLKDLPKNADILELGSASGRDADYIESLGYSIVRTDVVEAFVNHQKERGKDAEIFNAINGNLNKRFNLIIATASFLHFNRAQFEQAVENARNHLKTNGVLALVLKNGIGEEYSEYKMGTRYFKYWTEEELTQCFTERNFTIKQTLRSGGGKWVHIVGTPN